MLTEYTRFRHDSNDDMESHYDRADFEIDIPTRNLDILVAVDFRLFGERSAFTDPTLKLKFDIRNRDGVPFSSSDAVDHFLNQDNISRIGNRYEPGMEAGRDVLYRETVQHVRERTEEYARSLDSIQAHRKKGTPLTDKQIKSARDLSVLPERFLFYRVSWIGAHIGLTCSIRFPKPS